MQAFHLCIRTQRPLRPFADRELCADMWARLQRRFERVLACVLMPNHIHLILNEPDAALARRKLSIEATAFARSRFSGLPVWEPAGQVEWLPDQHHLRRTIRYVHLNPCRSKIVNDPLRWEWSTHRDAVGAVSRSWMDLREIRKLFHRGGAGFANGGAADFAAEFHSYVSSDPSVSVTGTTLPIRPDPKRLVASLDQIEVAVLQSTRASEMRFRVRGSELRMLAAHMAIELGGRNRQDLAQWLGLSRTGLRAILERPMSTAEDREALRAAFWILSQSGSWGWVGAEAQRTDSYG